MLRLRNNNNNNSNKSNIGKISNISSVNNVSIVKIQKSPKSKKTSNNTNNNTNNNNNNNNNPISNNNTNNNNNSISNNNNHSISNNSKSRPLIRPLLTNINQSSYVNTDFNQYKQYINTGITNNNTNTNLNTNMVNTESNTSNILLSESINNTNGRSDEKTIENYEEAELEAKSKLQNNKYDFLLPKLKHNYKNKNKMSMPLRYKSIISSNKPNVEVYIGILIY